MSIIEIKNLSKSYTLDKQQKQTIFEHLNLTIATSGMIAIVGESGSGKSTLMNMLGGMDTNYDGEILIENQNIRDLDLDEYRKNRLGFVFQSFNLIPNLTVLENVELALDLSGTNKEEKRQRALSLLEKVKLGDHVSKKISQLSGGQKQRVAIARSLANDPDIILADEPTGALDKQTSAEIMELLKTIAAEGKLVILITHSDRVAKACDRIIRIDDGRIIEDRSTHEIQTKFIKKEKRSSQFSLIAAWRFAFKNLLRNKKRNLLVALGGSIGIFSVIIVLGLSSGIKGYLYNELVGNTDTLNISATKGVSFGPGAENVNQAQFQFTSSEIKQLSSIAGVETYTTNSTLQGNSLLKLGDKQVPLMMVTSDLSQAKTLVAGKMPQDGELLITEKTASSLVGENQKSENLIGKKVSLSLAVGDQVFKQDLRISGIAKPNSTILNSIAIGLVSDAELSKIFSKNGVDYHPTAVVLRAKDEQVAPQIADEIKKMGYKGSAMEGAIDQINQYLSLATAILVGLASISLLVSSIMILVVMYISVVERTKEIGVLRAIGARKKDIRRMFISEAAGVGLFSGLIGSIVASVLGLFVNMASQQMVQVNLIDISILYILVGLGVSIVVSILAGYFPAAKAAKLDPIEALHFD
ncbi:ABC transporter ATP-binding protein/permease [Enterococcus sp. AZ102]|uniref:ABC transporter ATP-binding protein/permease n=1 Tax=Enterococcus sp. AZ102 TaxID=2774865 RepID=UPI003F200DB3